MTSNNTKNLSKRMAELEKTIMSTGMRENPGLFDDAILRWGPVPADLLADTETIPARTPGNPFVAVECLDICNRAARWIATGSQWSGIK